ncbi:hypothetical protein M5689_017878 [Euphorbia peplus]|nr:hypothetical protein M5689_017878 [Euphorbia peplus]
MDCQAHEPVKKVEVELVDYVNHQRQQGGGPFVQNPTRGYQNHPAYSWEPTRRTYDQQPQDSRPQYSAQSSQPQQHQYSQPAQRHSQPAPPYVPPQQQKEEKKPSMEEIFTQFMQHTMKTQQSQDAREEDNRHTMKSIEAHMRQISNVVMPKNKGVMPSTSEANP